MILLLSDWSKYPSAIADTQTKNKSFLRMAQIYKQMGIANHMFLLALINPDLQGVDPHDPNLTEEQQTAVLVECRLNPWYFFREVTKAPPLAGGEPVLFEANRANISVLWCFFMHIMYILIQPRQTGKSFTINSLLSLLMNIRCLNTQINLLTKDDTLRRESIKNLKDVMLELPPYLYQRGKNDSNNSEGITIGSLNNTFITHVPQSSPKAALKMGRGLTSPIFWVDEPPFQQNIKIALGAALGASGAAVDRAKEHGTDFGTVLTTTAGKRDDPDGAFIYGMIQEAADWSEQFLDAASEEELRETVRKHSRGNKIRVHGSFNHRQLGKTDAWLKEKIDASTQSGEDADRDFFCRWTAGSASNPLPVQMLERISASKLDPVFMDIAKPHNYITKWYLPENEARHRLANGKIVVAMDPSEAGGGDDIGFLATDIESLETVAAGNFNETNVISFAEWICDLIVENQNSLVMIIEARSMGRALMDYLLVMLPARGVDPFKVLYNKVVQEYEEQPERYDEIKQPLGRRPTNIYSRYKMSFGFATSASGVTSRSELYSTTLKIAAKRSCDKIRDKTLIDQINGLITRNGRVDHAIGEHDDIVIAWLLTHWFLTQGKNLEHYGIDVRRIGCKAIEDTSKLSKLEQYQLLEQRKIRDRIGDIYELLTKENDEFIMQKLVHELRMLDKKIILEANEFYSVDEVVRQAQEIKRQHHFNKRMLSNHSHSYA